MRTLNIQLSERAYATLQEEARERGRSVEATAARSLEAQFADDEMPADFWTPELLARLDAAVAEADRGGGISLDEMRAELQVRSRSWRANPPG